MPDTASPLYLVSGMYICQVKKTGASHLVIDDGSLFEFEAAAMVVTWQDQQSSHHS